MNHKNITFYSEDREDTNLYYGDKTKDDYKNQEPNEEPIKRRMVLTNDEEKYQVNEYDIELMFLYKSNAFTRDEAIYALKKTKGDVVDAIMLLIS